MVEDSHLQIYLSVEKNKETAMEEAGRRNVAVYFYMLLFEYTGRLVMMEWNIEIQRCEIHMVGMREGRREMAVNWTRGNDLQTVSRPFGS